MSGGKKCIDCSSTRTYIRNGKWEEWCHWEGKLLCSKCYGKRSAKRYRKNNLEKVREADRKRQKQIISFKGKEIYLKTTPRTGVCSKCHRSVARGEIKRTNMHHEKYDENDPLAHTIELCVHCHYLRHQEIRKMKKKALKLKKDIDKAKNHFN